MVPLTIVSVVSVFNWDQSVVHDVLFVSEEELIILSNVCARKQINISNFSYQTDPKVHLGVKHHHPPVDSINGHQVNLDIVVTPSILIWITEYPS